MKLAKPAKYADICATIKAASEGAMKGILGYSEVNISHCYHFGQLQTSNKNPENPPKLMYRLVQTNKMYRNFSFKIEVITFFSLQYLKPFL